MDTSAMPANSDMTAVIAARQASTTTHVSGFASGAQLLGVAVVDAAIVE